jgi:hypothetical protein
MGRARIDETAAGLQVLLPDERRLTFTPTPLPDAFLRWQCDSRLRLFEMLGHHGASAARAHPAHLAVLATLGEGPFPINLACKGMGLVPRPDILQRFVTLFESTREKLHGLPWPETLPQRLDAARALYERPEHFDPGVLGGLEIFEGHTAQNIERNPLATLLFSGEPPRFPSYQLCGVIQRIEPGEPLFRFLVAARELFAADAFHLRQQSYPFAFAFRVIEAHDKTPFSRG